MNRVLVTGGSGFIGQHLVAALLARGRAVRVLDLNEPCRSLSAVEYVEGSVLDGKLVDKALCGVDEVYHIAGLPGLWLPRKDDFHAVNCRGTELVIAAARERGVRRFLHCSTESILFHTASCGDVAEESLAVPDDMPGPYTRSKLLAEQHAMRAAASGFPVVIGSPTMPIGHHEHELTPPSAMLRHFLRGRIQLYLDCILNLVDVRDVATGLILTMEQGRAGQRYVLGGESLPLRKVLALVSAISGRRSVLVPMPARIAEALAAVMELIADRVTRKPPSGTAEGVRIARRSAALPIDKARCELGYMPRPVEPALRETIIGLLNGGAGHKSITASAPLL